MYKIKLFDRAREYRSLESQISEAVQSIVTRDQLKNGTFCRRLEDWAKAYFGARYVMVVQSGTAALFLSVKACGLDANAEVITTPNSDISTTSAVTNAGARFRLVDVSPEDLNLDPAQLAPAITAHTRAIIAVHLHGYACEMNAVMAFANDHGLTVIEDACLALGGSYQGRKLGSIGRIGCFSFGTRKVVSGLGSGGMVITDDPVIAEKVSLLRGYGEPSLQSIDAFKTSFNHVAEGFNLQMDEVHAAVLLVKLRHLDEWIGVRQELAARYVELLQGRAVTLSSVRPGSMPVYRNFPVRVRGRDRIRRLLREAGIETGIHYYPPVHRQAVYAQLGYSLPVCEQASEEIITLPCHPFMSPSEVDFVCTRLIEALDKEE